MKTNIETNENENITTEKYEDKQSLLSTRSLVVFSIGFFGYGLIEICFRGYTHWSMLLTGGACFLTMYLLNLEYKNTPLLLKALGGAAVITVYELAVGIIVNLLFKFNVWDYSALPFDFMGQICPLFSAIWFCLCLLLLSISKLLYRLNRYWQL